MFREMLKISNELIDVIHAFYSSPASVSLAVVLCCVVVIVITLTASQRQHAYRCLPLPTTSFYLSMYMISLPL